MAADEKPLLVVIMPALNEAPTVAATIAGIPPRIGGIGATRVLVIDDGSTDETADLARQAGATVISHGRRRGVGAAFRTGLSRALEMGADLIAMIDADGQFDPADLPRLVAPVVGGQADFATASRFKDPALLPDMPRVKLWGNRMMSRLISRLAGQQFYDVSCGMRCYDRKAAMHLNLMGTFTYTQEVFLNLAFKGLRMVEVPVKVRGRRQHGKSRVANNVVTYGLNALAIILRCYRDYQPMRFFGWLSAAMIVPGLLLGLFLLAHYLRTGSFSPHKWAGFTGGAMLVLGVLLFQMALFGDMLCRHRIYLEELLYHRRAAANRQEPGSGTLNDAGGGGSGGAKGTD